MLLEQQITRRGCAGRRGESCENFESAPRKRPSPVIFVFFQIAKKIASSILISCRSQLKFLGNKLILTWAKKITIYTTHKQICLLSAALLNICETNRGIGTGEFNAFGKAGKSARSVFFSAHGVQLARWQWVRWMRFCSRRAKGGEWKCRWSQWMSKRRVEPDLVRGQRQRFFCRRPPTKPTFRSHSKGAGQKCSINSLRHSSSENFICMQHTA